MANYSMLEEGFGDSIAASKRKLYEQAAARVARNDPSRDVVDPDSLQSSVYIALMDYTHWPQELGRFEKLSQTHAGNQAHVEWWFSKESPFNQIAVSSVQGSYAPPPKWMTKWYAKPFWLANRFYHWAWKGRTKDDGTFARMREFTNPFYKYYRIPLSPNEMDRLYMFSYEQDGKPFNWIGSARSWSKRLYRKTTGTKWFCSELWHSGFKYSGVLDRLAATGRIDPEFANINSGLATPTKIYDNICAPDKGIVIVTDNQTLGERRAEMHFTGPPSPAPASPGPTFSVIRSSKRGRNKRR